MKIDTRKRKNAMAGIKQLSGEEQMLRTMFGVIQDGKKALDGVMLDMGRMVAESIMLMEREELAGPDYHPTNPRLQKWNLSQPPLGFDPGSACFYADFFATAS